MKAFVAIASLLAAASADQSSHQTTKLGNAPAVHTSVHRPHGTHHATVVSQPSAQPSEVHQAYNEEKYVAAVHAPVSKPVHAPAYHGAPVHHAPAYHAAPVHHAAPAYHAAPVHHAPAYHAAPVHHAPAYHAAPVVHAAPAYHKPAPAYKPVVHAPAYKAPVHAPAYHAPAPAYKPAHPAPAYHAEPEYEGPAVYKYGYAVADDYSGSNFAQNENRDGYATAGEYRVNLPDGRTQIVSYSVADAYSGYVADVRYEGEAKYAPYTPKEPAYHAAPVHHAAPAYHAAPVHHAAPAYHAAPVHHAAPAPHA